MKIDESILGSIVHAAYTVASLGSGRNRLLILCYHRVLAGPDAMLPDTVDSTLFEAQIRLLADKFNTMPLFEAVERLALDSLPKRAVSVSFDDGYADNYEVALPILQKFRVPATFFVACGYLNGGRMWNDTVTESVRSAPGDVLDLTDLELPRFSIRSLEERGIAARTIVQMLRQMTPSDREKRTDDLAQRIGTELPDELMLTSDQVRKLHSSGMEVGAHTVTHPVLTSLPDNLAKIEIRDSRRILEEIIDFKVSGFAYPSGRPGRDYGRTHVDAVASSGFSYAVSTARGSCSKSTDLYQLPRLDPWDKHPLKFGLRLATEFRLPPSNIL